MKTLILLIVGALLSTPAPSDAWLDIFNDDDGDDNGKEEDNFWQDVQNGIKEAADGVGEFMGTVTEGLSEKREQLQSTLSGITGQDIYNAAGDVVGFVAETGVYFSELSDIDGQDVYDAVGNVIGTVTKAVKEGVDEQDLTMAETFKLVSDGAELVAGAVSIGMDATAAVTKGGTCTVTCAVAERDSKENGVEHDLARCIGACGLEFADDAAEVAANVLDGVAAMLEDNVCGSVDIVADILGSTASNLGEEAGEAVAGAIAGSDVAADASVDGDAAGTTVSEIFATGADLFSGVLKGSCDVLECAGAVMPPLANAARDFDPTEIVAAIDVAIAEAGGSECAAAVANIGDSLHAGCLAGSCGECAAAVAAVDIESAVNTCAPGVDAIAESAAHVIECIDNLSDVDEKAAVLLNDAVAIVDAETFTIQAELDARVAAAAEACGIGDDNAWTELTQVQKIDKAIMAALNDPDLGRNATNVLVEFLSGKSAAVLELPIDELLARDDVKRALEGVLDADQLDAVANSAASMGEADEADEDDGEADDDDDNSAAVTATAAAAAVVAVVVAFV